MGRATELITDVLNAHSVIPERYAKGTFQLQ